MSSWLRFFTILTHDYTLAVGNHGFAYYNNNPPFLLRPLVQNVGVGSGFTVVCVWCKIQPCNQCDHQADRSRLSMSSMLTFSVHVQTAGV